ncbi:MAG: metallophosphoesterase [Thermoplasmata archaeon]
MVFQHEIEIANGIFLSEHRAVFLKPLSVCVISDLHIGLESGMLGVEMNVHIQEMQERIGKLIERYKPEKLVVNGDFKHTFSGNVKEEWEGVPEILDYLAETVDVWIVRGNHDNFLQSITSKQNVKFVECLELGNFIFLHGHKEFSFRPGSIYVLGHEHPAVKLSDRVGGYVKMPVFLWSQNRFLLLPAFSPWTYGHDLADGDVLLPSLRHADYLEAEVVGWTEYGLLRMPRLRELLAAGRL